jgi:hypothetical protein
MKIKLETVTPEIARQLLKKNDHNRRVRDTHVDFLAAEMANSRWHLTSETIAIATDGTVVDGQHRLLAVAQSGATIQVWVARDVPIEAQEYIDIGTPRNAGDQLGLGGLEYANQKVSAARTIISMCCYYQNPKASIGMIRLVLEEYERDIEFCIKKVIDGKFRPGAKGWVYGTLAFALNADRSVAPFIEAFGSGIDLSRGNPAKAARDWLTNGGVALRSSYRKTAIEGLCNAAYNSIMGGSISSVRRGSQGLDYFTGKKRRSVATIREQMKQQIVPAEEAKAA